MTDESIDPASHHRVKWESERESAIKKENNGNQSHFSTNAFQSASLKNKITARGRTTSEVTAIGSFYFLHHLKDNMKSKLTPFTSKWFSPSAWFVSAC